MNQDRVHISVLGLDEDVIVIADSIARNGKRITTLEVPLWRALLAEFNTHRMFSRGSASSRAIPVTKMLERILLKPFIPVHWPRNQKGMQGGPELDGMGYQEAVAAWLEARMDAVKSVQRLTALGLHKSIPNRLLEPWMVTRIVVTATEWENMLALRTETQEDGTPMAEPHFFDVAEAMVSALNASTPRSLMDWQAHLPYITDEEWASTDWDEGEAVLVRYKQSAARCGRVSYLKQDGIPATPEEDFARHDEFIRCGHMGPVEHQAHPTLNADLRSGNFIGWHQYRQWIHGESRAFTKLEKKTWEGPR